MRQTPVNDYLEEISTRLPEEIYGYLSDAIYETVCEFDEEVAQLQAENAKMRELASLVSEYISHDRCEGCVIKTACNSHELDECWMTTKLRNQLHELGVEAD